MSTSDTLDDMTKQAELEALADLLRRNAPRWMVLDQASDRGRVANRASNWNHRPPRAFAHDGFEFRTHTEHKGPRGILLEGRYIGPLDS